MGTREYTNKVLELCDEGLLSWQSLAEMAVSYMSEDQVKDMCVSNDILDDDEEEE